MIIPFLRKKVNAYFLQPELFLELKNFMLLRKAARVVKRGQLQPRVIYDDEFFVWAYARDRLWNQYRISLPPLKLFFITAYARFRTLCVFSAGAGFFTSFAVTACAGGTVASAATAPRNFFPHGESYYGGDDYRRRDYYYNFRNHGIPPAFTPRLSDGGTNRTFCLLPQSR